MQLYRYLEDADSSVDVALTEDVDFAVPKRLESTGELRRRLADHGLVRIPSRATDPPITYFQVAEYGSENLAPTYVEFLTPLVGSSKHGGPVFIAPDVTAQRRRYLDLSFSQPMTLSLTCVPMLAEIGVTSVRIPSPASYLIAKALVYKLRGARRDKDCAYIYLLARITRRRWSDVQRDLDALEIHPSWRKKAYDQLRTLFESELGEGPSSGNSCKHWHRCAVKRALASVVRLTAGPVWGPLGPCACTWWLRSASASHPRAAVMT